MSARDLIFTILGIDKASPAFDKVGNSAQRAGDRIDKAGTLAIKSMLGIEAAGIASGLAIAGALGGVPVLFAGVAAAALKSNKEVQDSFKNLASHVRDDVKSMTEPLVDDFLGVANDLGTAWGRDVAPVLKSIFADPALGQGIREISKGIGELAAEAMPGFLTAVRASPPVMSAFRSVLKDTGTGVNDFFTNISKGSEASGQIVSSFGRITSDVLGDVGDLVAKLANAVAPHMGQVEQLFDRSTNSVLGLATNALPVLTSASGATVGVLNSVLGVLEPISGTLGTGLGLTLAAAGGWKVLTGAGNAFTKLDLGGKLERTALSAGVMTESLTGSAVAGERVATAGSRMATVLRGVGTAIPFVGAAAIALSLALESSNKTMEQAADRGKALGESLIKGGSEADRARLQISNLSGENSQLQKQLDGMRASWDGNAEGAQAFAAEAQGLQDKINLNNVTLTEARKQYDDIRSKLTGAELAQVKYNEAVDRYGTASPEAAAAGTAWRAALDEEARKSRAAADAVKTHTDRIVEQQAIKLGAIGAEIAHQNALLGVEQAQKGYTEAVQQHGAASFEARSALNAYEASIMQVVVAAGEKSRAENQSRSEADQVRLASEAEALAILNMAAAAGSSAPPALQSMVNSLSATTLAAIGVTGRINETGQAVYRLPDGKEIVISGNNAEAMSKMQAVNNYRIADKTFYIHQITLAETRVSQGLGGMARGGEPELGRPLKVNEEGKELFVPTTPGVIIPHSATVALQRAGRMGEGKGKVEKHFHLTVNASNSTVDLRRQFEIMEHLAGVM